MTPQQPISRVPIRCARRRTGRHEQQAPSVPYRTVRAPAQGDRAWLPGEEHAELNRLTEEERGLSDATDCFRMSAAHFWEVQLPPRGLVGSSRWPRKADRPGYAGGLWLVLPAAGHKPGRRQHQEAWGKRPSQSPDHDRDGDGVSGAAQLLRIPADPARAAGLEGLP